MTLIDLDATTLSRQIASGTTTAEEAMRACLDRIEEVNGQVNAIVALRDADDLMAEARAADAAPRKGWLHGIPVAVKDLANAAGLPGRCGLRAAKGRPVRQPDAGGGRDLHRQDQYAGIRAGQSHGEPGPWPDAQPL